MPGEGWDEGARNGILLAMRASLGMCGGLEMAAVVAMIGWSAGRPQGHGMSEVPRGRRHCEYLQARWVDSL